MARLGSVFFVLRWCRVKEIFWQIYGYVVDYLDFFVCVCVCVFLVVVFSSPTVAIHGKSDGPIESSDMFVC